MVVFAGVLSNTASEVGYVLLVPLAALIFLAAGRHPLLGLAAAFAGVSGGYSANLLLGTIDPLLSGLTQEAARIVDPTYVGEPGVQLLLHVRLDVPDHRPRLPGSPSASSCRASGLEATPGTTRRGRTMRSATAAEKRGLWSALLVIVLRHGAVLLCGPAARRRLPARPRDRRACCTRRS